jgi:hypothetical protein
MANFSFEFQQILLKSICFQYFVLDHCFHHQEGSSMLNLDLQFRPSLSNCSYSDFFLS